MVYIDIKGDNYTKDELKRIANCIKVGGVGIVPTDTVYGLVTDALNRDAVKRIYALKGRDFSKPMNVLVSNLDMIYGIVNKVSDLEYKVMERFFPGALTVIFDKNECIPDIVTANLNTIGIRMPNNRFLLELI